MIYYYHVVVDTGGSCLTLPSEIFDDLKSWWKPLSIQNIQSTDLQSLPALKFTLADVYTSNDNANDELIIYLSNLVVNKSEIPSELNQGGGLLLSSSTDSTLAVCVLRGASVYGTDDQMRIPHISLGSLVLRSLYFAADYSSGGVGLANKYDKFMYADANIGLCPYCKSQVQCVGQQALDDYSNSCVDPACSSYFFAKMDESTHT